MKQILALHPGYATEPFKNGSWPLFAAVATRSREAVEFLLDAHAPIDSKEPNGSTALNLTVTANSSELATLLLDRGANPQIGGFSALIIAATDCKVEMMQLLLDKGADVNFQVQGTTALDHALLVGNKDCIKLLKGKGGKSGKDL